MTIVYIADGIEIDVKLSNYFWDRNNLTFYWNCQLYHKKKQLQLLEEAVGIALGYWLDDRGSRVRFPTWAGNFSLHHRVQNGSAAHPASYPVGTRDSFPGGKAAGA